MQDPVPNIPSLLTSVASADLEAQVAAELTINDPATIEEAEAAIEGGEDAATAS